MTTDPASEFLAGVVGIQVQLGLDAAQEKEPAQARLSDKWALGYVYGCFDIACQLYGMEQESDDGVDLLMGLLRHLYGVAAPLRFQRIVELQSDEQFTSGATAGGKQALRFVDGQTTGVHSLGSHIRGAGPQTTTKPSMAKPRRTSRLRLQRRLADVSLVALLIGVVVFLYLDYPTTKEQQQSDFSEFGTAIERPALPGAGPRFPGGRLVGPATLPPTPLPKPTRTNPNSKPVALSTGVIWVHPCLPKIAPFEVRTTAGSDYFIKLVDTTGQPVLEMYVEGGRTLATEVPLGTYELRYAVSREWYGEADKRLFGDRTDTYKADKPFDFQQRGSEVRGYTVELIMQQSGNLGRRRIPPSEF